MSDSLSKDGDMPNISKGAGPGEKMGHTALSAPTMRQMLLKDACQRIVDLEAERDDMRAWGDNMQSEASRLAEWVRERGLTPTYEAHMALSSVEGLIGRWTEIRRAGS